MADASLMSEGYRRFLSDTPEHSRAWMEAVEKLGHASRLDAKTAALCYLSVLATARLGTGVPFHVSRAKAAGATREEVISAVLIGLPAVGNVVVEALAPALQAYDTAG